jgi:hypothetical protein
MVNKERLFQLVCTGLLILTGVNGVAAWRRSQPTTKVGRYVAAMPGTTVDAPLRRGDGVTSTTLKAVASGRCAYVVVTEPNCGAGAAAARHWGRSAAPEVAGAKLKGWDVVWVSVGSATAMRGYYPASFPVETLSADNDELMRALGISAFPAHLVLDRGGVIREADVGAPIPRSQQLNEDCSVAWTR